MKLRIFPTAGEALNFGFRRLETTARIGWIPAILLGVTQLAAVFGLLSVLSGQAFTFTDIQEIFETSPSFAAAKQILAMNFLKGWSAHAPMLSLVIGLFYVANLILITSIIVPMIKYAATGEKPPPGALKVSFGADESRFLAASFVPLVLGSIILLGPIVVTGFYAIGYIVSALSQTVVTFPDAESLHTITETTLAATTKDSPLVRLYSFAYPMAVSLPFAFLLWFVLLQHFHPRNRPEETARGNWLMRAATILLVSVILLALAFTSIGGNVVETLKQMSGVVENEADSLTAGSTNVGLYLASAALVLFAYFNVRFLPYPGVAVGAQSLRPHGVLSLTRGWNILRLIAILLLLGFLLLAIQIFVINALLLQFAVPSVVTLLYNVSAVSTRLVNSGVTADWVLPVWIWIWNIAKFLINIVWMFFTYGVLAGLYGRLSRIAAAHTP